MLCATLALAACEARGEVAVTVRNASPVVAEDVELRWESWRVGVGTLAPGQARTVRIPPQPESGLRVAFRRPDGDRVERFWDVGYDADARAHVTVTIRADGEVHVHDPEVGAP